MLGRMLPKLFHRRLVLLSVLCAGAFGVMLLQTARLAFLENERHAADAEAWLVRESWSPTVRGQILDRRGRVLATAVPGYSVEIEFPVLSGDWARDRAERYAKRLYAAEWGPLPAERKATVLARFQRVYAEHARASWAQIAALTGATEEEIHDRAERTVARVNAMHARLVEVREARALAELEEQGRPITDDQRRRIRARAEQPIREQAIGHPVVPRVSDGVAFELIRLAERSTRLEPAGPQGPPDEVPTVPGLSVRDAGDRTYPHEVMPVDVDLRTLPGPLRGEGRATMTVRGVCTHLLGWMRPRVFAEDQAARRAFLEEHPENGELLTPTGADRGAYREGESVGATGLERTQEHRLRGLRGYAQRRLDSGRVEAIEPSPGADVVLTIDVALQARVMAAMDPGLGLAEVQAWHGPARETMPLGTPINGAAVVMEIETGEILAMVSTPSFTREKMREEPDAVFRDEVDYPWLNRAIGGAYPPGSIVKAMILCGASARGVYTPGERISCTGHFLEGRSDRLRCWIYRQYLSTHDEQLGGPPDGAEALMVSCNIFFYELGKRLGPAGILDVYRRFGMGETWDLGVGAEYSGALGPMGRSEATTPGDAILMGIGQGPVAWTPLHAAEAMAAIARGGRRLRPTLVLGEGSRQVGDLGLDPVVVEETMRGLEMAVGQPRGTGHQLVFISADGTVRRTEPVFNAPGVRVWGKTGTAQAPVQTVTDEETGERVVVRDGSHSWFVVLVGDAGDERPRYAISVLMEHAGSGGRVSGPVTNQIIHALIEEGYLRASG